jgi:hypothetical protein
LGNSVAHLDRKLLEGISVVQNYLYFAAISGIDNPGGIHQPNTVLCGDAAAWHDIPDIAIRKGD